ncbi:hypothetical protein [Delftia phage PhiW-14]|uniref:Uncharacterized protein n=1 Tax=Delftia phage PhiW-14 TaxID=665032 RepID=C9DGE1_BPW14|nr:hypothetical protein DP-phiW-14_gp171 [Delftia phage PhiW-14]ACV50192.1 hypothetical protein [Delftia phage PhiW-14]
MTNKFNPFREALAYLKTAPGFYRGEYPQHPDAREDELLAMQQVVSRGQDIDDRSIARKAIMLLRDTMAPHSNFEDWLKAHIPGVNTEDKDDVQVRRFVLLIELANDYDNGTIQFTSRV